MTSSNALTSASPLAQDLEHIFSQTELLWEELRGKRLFITGGTGFFGTWLLESFHHANERLNLGAQAVVLTRDPAAFARKSPRLAGTPNVRCLEGDVLTLGAPQESFDFCIHAATSADDRIIQSHPFLMLDTVVTGTRRVLEFAEKAGVRKFLFTSTGGIYGRQPLDLARVPEDYPGAPDPLEPKSAYAESKRIAETLCSLSAGRSGMEVKIARCFAFLGPGLPLDRHYAIGNFVRDALQGGPIRIQGDGTALRAYLYAADLAIWLWTILFQGKLLRAYNVGSEEALSIREWAERVINAVQPANRTVEVKTPPAARKSPERYIPSTERARSELGLSPRIPLEEGIRRMVAWNLTERDCKAPG